VFESAGGVAAAVEEAHRVLSEKGYLPYYLYRQKNMAENLENTGYCLPGRQCVNNITVMEESLSVIACGAGAISKRVFAKDNRIERHPNLRDIKLYMAEFEDRLTRKERFFTE
jgi:oxygen-independent coproporphyrinogen-3 oxidase